MITLDQASVTYTAQDDTLLAAVGPVSAIVEKGQFLCLLGPSGCGKSTLIRTIAGLQPATGGSVTVNGTQVIQPQPQVGMMFQDANLLPWRTVAENISLPLILAGVPEKTHKQLTTQMLERLGLSEFAHVYPSALSGGMAQRVALGRVLIGQPQVMLLDEPFGALDALSRERISLDLLYAWQQEGQTVVMVTHDVNEAILLSNRVWVLSKRPGTLVLDMAVDLPYPRTAEMLYLPEFAALALRARGQLQQA